MDWPVSTYVHPELNSQIFLPPLREELKLLPAAANHDGSPAWMVQDPINNSFFVLGGLILRCYCAGPTVRQRKS